MVRNQLTNYDEYKCTYDYITEYFKKETAGEKCNLIAHGFCDSPNHYINVFEIYYCWLKMSNPLHIAFSVIATIWLFSMLNYIRRGYFVRPLMKLRKVLGVKSSFAEYVIIPIAHGIVPLIFRLQGSVHNLDLGFNFGGTLGALFALNTFCIGTCAVVLSYSRKVDMGALKFNIGFLFGMLILYGMVALQGYIQIYHGIVFIFGWILIIFFSYIKEKKVTKSKYI